ncbi:crotonase/enoyl-CoA hydratase family protein [Azospirillum griseum]|uniref:Crotonase/enoyl-CoA hydratase family protein n=1 Tax=Azospirillum griseum TaxID=2496639 RepID=A0A431V9P9_9PROT|nr:crotonase/enoyl-CoA hydratase family protein [Azospirillum griseum]RTR12453.1 crotonase/enoyl-CoA hydratase family protein [Azospirillum griseum]
MTDCVLSARKGAVVTLTLNRPDRLNAMDFTTIARLHDLLDGVEVDETVRAVILTGAGDKAFCAGADIREFSASVWAGPEIALREFVRVGQRFTSRLEAFPKPIIAAVNGLAFGGGCEVTEAVPLAIASERARFAKSEIKLGFPPPYGGTQRLPRLIGRKRALAMLLTGDSVSAADALACGLVNQVVAPDRLLDAAHALADRIVAMPAVAVTACLAAVTRGLNLSIDEGLAVEASQFARTVSTQDIREGITAFLDKRPARFVGR